MDFKATETQKTLIERTLKFACAQLNDGFAEREATATFGLEEWRRCGQFGLLGAAVPVEHGGWGLERLTAAMVFEAFGKGCRDGGLGFSAGAHAFACAAPLARFAGDEVRGRWLPRLASGSAIGAHAVTEHGAGSDTAAMAARATRTRNGYHVRAQKLFVTNAPIADLFIVLASTNPQHGPLGLTAFVVERTRDGVSVGAPVRMSGLQTSPVGPLDVDCEVPESHCLGGAGRGREVFEVAMEWERTCLFAFWLGALDRQLQETVDFARTRRQFGRPIGANQAISHRLADMKMRIETARLLLHRAAWEADAGCRSPMNISLAKLAISEAAVQSSIDSIQIHGAAGVIRGGGAEGYLRDAIAGTIYSGTSEMHREIIARGLGLPSHPRVTSSTTGCSIEHGQARRCGTAVAAPRE